MNIAELQSVLTEASVYGSMAMLLVLVLRRPLRSVFGAGAAYLAWSLVPLAMVSALLPAATHVPSIAAVSVIGGWIQAAPADAAHTTAGAGSAGVLLAVWAIGALITTLVFALRQRQFVRGLGQLVARGDGTHLAQVSGGLPAVIGILRPRIVLPADHEIRFDPGQQLLVLEHEKMHIARGDHVFNLLALVLRCLFWFNPLVYWAAPRFRQDQELACDARVVARHPQARRIYGEALLGVQLTGHAAPLSCQMGFAHPLKERIAMLKQPMPNSKRRVTGFTVVVVLAAAAGFAANAAQEAQLAQDTPMKVMFRPDHGDYFPREAQGLGLSGKVLVEAQYDVTGAVTSVAVAQSDADGAFDSAALEYARQIRFRPATRDGIPVAGRVVVPVRFEWKPSPQ
jgi:bla regulator protein BlaR1